MSNNKSTFTKKQDQLIVDLWPDYRKAAMLIDNKSNIEVYNRGYDHLGLGASGYKDKISDKERAAKRADSTANYFGRIKQ